MSESESIVNVSEGVPNGSESALSDFLLARIAEDEAAPQPMRLRYYHGGARVAPHSERVPFNPAFDPTRVVSEYELRPTRRQVEAVMASDDYPVLREASLRRMAAAYGDHPDYRAEWRP